MNGQSIPLATKGIIYCPTATTVETTKDCVLPFHVKFTKNDFNLNLSKQSALQISTNINTKSINLTKKQFSLAPKLFKNFTLNLKKCEE